MKQLEGMDLIRSIPGLLAKVAAGTGTTRANVATWRVVPLARVPEVERITGFSRRVLRPDYSWDEPQSVRACSCRIGT